MKIGIITVYYSENSGSLLQAISLKKKLEELGHDVVFIKTKNKYSSHSIKLLLGRVARETLKLHINNVRNAIGKYFNYRKDIKRFNVINIEDAYANNIDLLVIGSDTVWDIESQYFKESFKTFLPQNEFIPTVSYAASVGNTKRESLKKDIYAMNALKELKAISVRDEYSKEVLAPLVDNKIEIVCDPTIMIEKEVFDEFTFKPEEKKYVLIYSFNNFEKEIVRQIKEYAKENDLSIISVGNKYDWTDKNIICSLDTFISYYKSAECVITNTFHGNVFSIIFNKQFINIDFGKKKVNKLLEHYDLTDRVYIEGKSKVSEILGIAIDYSKVNKTIEQDKINANSFINRIVDRNNKKIYG